MSNLALLKPADGATHYRKRVGRGIGSGIGGTSAKGNKGQIARSGGKVRRGFEGGQTPLSRRLPKFGFSNVKFETKYEIVNLESLNKLDGDVNPQTLKEAGIVSKGLIKLLGNGIVSKKFNVKVHKASKSAMDAIVKAGGTVEIIK